jgi:hypothetical protein
MDWDGVRPEAKVQGSEGREKPVPTTSFGDSEVIPPAWLCSSMSKILTASQCAPPMGAAMVDFAGGVSSGWQEGSRYQLSLELTLILEIVLSLTYAARSWHENCAGESARILPRKS